MHIQQNFSRRFIFLILCALSICSHRLYSQTSPNYQIKASTISGGAAQQQASASWQASSSVGQYTSSPRLQGTQYFMQSGFNPIAKKLQMVVSVNTPEVETKPTVYRLYQNYPNPFNPTTTIQFDLPRQSEVTLSIYNINGQLVRTLIDGKLNAGSHSVVWDGRNEQGRQTTSGLYVTRMQAGEFVRHQKMLLIK